MQTAIYVLAAVGIATWAGGLQVARADDVVRVEEDWELVIGQPDQATDAPQLTCVISPIAEVDSAYAAFDINHHSQPSYKAGGLQLQVWSNNTPLLSDNDPDGETLSTAGETVTWTQKMELSQDNLTVSITNGNSATWGTFGGGGKLRITVGTSLTNLNAYSPNVSVANSAIGFASNRVQSLRIKCVRYYKASGQAFQDTTVRNVYDHE
ncbi:MAG TPA: hypothetical protein VGJ26_02890 [Pirellulales bacterium]